MNRKWRAFGLATALSLALLVPPTVAAHCDTLGGPVVGDAKIALEKGDVTPVLKWVKAQDESEIRALFSKTLKVRAQGAEARELADRYFFESLVRIHRAAEGAPYTGLKPAEAAEPITLETDKGIEAGTLDHLTAMLQEDLAKGIRQRFARVVEAKKHANNSVAAGREYVEAYVDFTHHVEAVHAAVQGQSVH